MQGAIYSISISIALYIYIYIYMYMYTDAPVSHFVPLRSKTLEDGTAKRDMYIAVYQSI